MTFQSTNNLYGFPQALTRVFPPPVLSQRAPLSTDYKYPIGQQWIDELGEDAYILVNVTGNSATWNVTATTPGNVDTLTGDSGGAITPSAGNINLLGTANQLTTTGSGHQIAYSIPATFIAPGSIASTTSLTAGSGFTVSAGAVAVTTGTSAINISADAANTTINIGTGAGVKTLTLGSTNTTSPTTLQSGSGALNITSTGGALTVNSGVGALSISNDAAATTVAIATGAGVKGVTLGSTNTTSATTVQSGSGALNITATGGALTINSGAGALSISNDATITTLTIGTGAAAKTCTFGSTNTTSTTTLQAGSGGITLTGIVTSANTIKINGAATQLQVHGGAVTDFIGQATLTNGTVTVANTNIAATDRIFVNRSAVNASSALGVFKVVITAATNFVITACKPADGTTETGDASTVDYFIVRQL